MRRGARRQTALVLVSIGVALLLAGCQAAPVQPESDPRGAIVLPPARPEGEISLEAAIAGRRSVRDFGEEALSLEQLSQLCWAAQGTTDPRGLRAAPSAGALYPLELYLLTADGLFHYRPEGHQLDQLSADDHRLAVWQAGLEQDSLREAPAVFALAAVYGRTAAKYGERAERYVHLEAGHAAQNLLLQAVALGLGGVPIGAFDDDQLQGALALPQDHAPLYLIPVGTPAQ